MRYVLSSPRLYTLNHYSRLTLGRPHKYTASFPRAESQVNHLVFVCSYTWSLQPFGTWIPESERGRWIRRDQRSTGQIERHRTDSCAQMLWYKCCKYWSVVRVSNPGLLRWISSHHYFIFFSCCIWCLLWMMPWAPRHFAMIENKKEWWGERGEGRTENRNKIYSKSINIMTYPG